MTRPPTALRAALIILLLATVGAVGAFGETPDEVFTFGKRLMRDGLYEAAAQQFLQFARENPTDRRAPDALQLAAECLGETGNEEQAVSVLESLIQTYADAADVCAAKVQLGRLYQKLERYEDADEIFTDVTVTMPDCKKMPDALLGKSEALISLKEYQAAADILSSLIKTYVESQAAPRAAYNLAFCYRKLGREDAGLATYKNICRQFPRDPLAAFSALEAARMLRERGDPNASVDYFDTARAFEAKVFQVPATMEGAEVLTEMGNHARALSWYEQLLTRRDLDDYRPVLVKAAESAYEAKNASALDMIAEEYDRRYPKTFSAQIAYVTALAAIDRGDYEAGIKAADRLESFAPGTEWAIKAPMIRGNALVELGRAREGVGELRRFVSIGADSTTRCRVLERIAEVNLTALRDTTAALNTMVELLEVQRRRVPSEILRVGRMHEDAGSFAEARRLYEDVIARSPLSDAAEEAEVRIRFLDEFTVSDYAKAAAAMDRSSLQIANTKGGKGVLQLARARMEILKDYQSALGLCEQLEKSAKDDPIYPNVLYLAGECHAKLARKALLTDRPNTAEDRMKEAVKKWDELERRHGGSDWAARGAIERELLRAEVEGAVDTTRALATLGRYPKHPESVAILEMLGDHFHAMGTPAGWSRAGSYYSSALKATPKEMDTRSLRYKHALTLSRRARYDDALKYLKDIADSGDDRIAVKAAYEAGVALRHQKKFNDAIPYFERVAERDQLGAFGVRATMQAADCYYLQRRLEEAMTRYRRAEQIARSERTRWEISYRIGLVLEQQHRYDEALERMQACIDGDSGGDMRPRAYQQGAEIARKLGDSRREMNILEAYVAEFPRGDGVGSAGKALVRACLRENDVERADELARQLSGAAGEKDHEWIALRAMTAYRKGDLGDGKKLAEEFDAKAGRDSPVRPEIAFHLARYYYEQEQHKQAADALAVFAEQCEGEGVCEESRYFYALSLFGAKQLDRGSRAAKKFFKDYPLSPYSPLLHLRMGNVLTVENRTSEALMHYEEAANTAQDSATVFFALRNLGVSYQRLKRWDEAERVWRSVLDQFTSEDFSREAALNIARCQMESGDYRGAIDAYKDAIPSLEGEEKARAHYWIAECHERLGNFQAAVVEYLKVPYMHKSAGLWVVTAQLKAAECYVKLDRGEAARDIYNQVIQAHGAGSNWGKLAQKGIDGIDGRSDEGGADTDEQ